MQTHILGITTWTSICVRWFFCCISCLLEFVTNLQRQLRQSDGGGSRLMWRVRRVAIFKAGISPSITSNHSCSMPSAACLEHLHSRLLAAAFLPTHQMQYGNSQQTRWKCIIPKTQPQKGFSYKFYFGHLFKTTAQTMHPTWWPMKMCNLAPEERKSLNSILLLRCSLYFCGDNHSFVSGQEPMQLQP